MLELVVPTLEEMWFREILMADEETMAYNYAWGGTIPFPKKKWKSWYDHWIVYHENKKVIFEAWSLKETGSSANYLLRRATYKYSKQLYLQERRE